MTLSAFDCAAFNLGARAHDFSDSIVFASCLTKGTAIDTTTKTTNKHRILFAEMNQKVDITLCSGLFVVEARQEGLFTSPRNGAKNMLSSILHRTTKS